MYLFQFLISRFNNAQHSRATTPKNTSTLVNTLDLVSMGSGSRKTRNKTPTSMAKTPTSNIVGSGTLSNQQKQIFLKIPNRETSWLWNSYGMHEEFCCHLLL